MLSDNWLTEKTTDFEYKKYVILGYLQKVYQSFDDSRLYPFLDEVNNHYSTLKNLTNNRRGVSNRMQKIKGFDWKSTQIEYEESNLVISKDVDRLISFSEPLITKAKNEGEILKSKLKVSLSIEPIGVVPIYQNEGFLLLSVHKQKMVDVYRYSNYTRTNNKGNYSYDFVNQYPLSIKDSFSKIKLSIANNFKFSAPAMYLIQSPKKYPIKQTFLPLAQELFEEHHKYFTTI